MSKKSKAIAPTKSELLPPQPESPEEVFRRIIYERAAEVMADKETAPLAPFFESAAVSEAIRHVQSVAERNKFAWLFERHGCLICQRTDVLHVGLSLCQTCMTRTRHRLDAVIRDHQPKEDGEVKIKDAVDIARRALLPSVRKIIEKERKP